MSRRNKIIIAVGAPAALLLLFIFREQFMGLFSFIGPCPFNEMTGYHCPGCGNTRSLNCLLHGELFLAIRNNPALPVISALLLFLYTEVLLDLFGKPVKLLTRKAYVWYSVLGLFGVFYIVRNFVGVLAPL